MGKGGNSVIVNQTTAAEVRKISLEELSHHRTPNDGNKFNNMMARYH